MIEIAEIKEIIRINMGERIGATKSEEERMNKDFDEVYEMKIVTSGKFSELKLHTYGLRVIRELIEGYETKERVKTF